MEIILILIIIGLGYVAYTYFQENININREFQKEIERIDDIQNLILKHLELAYLPAIKYHNGDKFSPSLLYKYIHRIDFGLKADKPKKAIKKKVGRPRKNVKLPKNFGKMKTKI